jgi:hypothetical protein
MTQFGCLCSLLFLLANGATGLLYGQVKTVHLNHGFLLSAWKLEDSLCSSITIHHNGKNVFCDSTDREYTLRNPIYPLIAKLDDHKYEFLIVFDNRPSKDLVLRLRINNDLVERIDTLPEFLAPAHDIHLDGEIEYAGFWDYGQIWEADGKTVGPYNPLLYYKLSSSGFLLDTATTIRVNRSIYGKFYGFDFSESIAIPMERSDHPFMKELNMITKKK